MEGCIYIVYIVVHFLYRESIGNGGSGADPPLGAVLDPMAAPTIVSEMPTGVPEPHTLWRPPFQI